MYDENCDTIKICFLQSVYKHSSYQSFRVFFVFAYLNDSICLSHSVHSWLFHGGNHKSYTFLIIIFHQ